MFLLNCVFINKTCSDILDVCSRLSKSPCRPWSFCLSVTCGLLVVFLLIFLHLFFFIFEHSNCCRNCISVFILCSGCSLSDFLLNMKPCHLSVGRFPVFPFWGRSGAKSFSTNCPSETPLPQMQLLNVPGQEVTRQRKQGEWISWCSDNKH